MSPGAVPFASGVMPFCLVSWWKCMHSRSYSSSMYPSCLLSARQKVYTCASHADVQSWLLYITLLMSCLGTWMSWFDEVLNACVAPGGLSWMNPLHLVDPSQIASYTCLLPAVRECTNSVRRAKPVSMSPVRNKQIREQVQLLDAPSSDSQQRITAPSGKDNTAERMWRSGSWILEHLNSSYLIFRTGVLRKRWLSLFGRTIFSKTLVFLESCPRESHSWYTGTISGSRPGRTDADPEPRGRLFFLVIGLIVNFLAYAHFYLSRNGLMITCTLFSKRSDSEH